MSNVIVISDLHLGAPLRASGEALANEQPISFGDLRRVLRHDRAVSHFIDYHRCHGETDTNGVQQPWTLVLNGDTFDFLHIDVRLRQVDSETLSEEEKLYGLDFDESRSLWKLETIIAVYRKTMRALARFIDAGHRVVVIAGNHDVDLWFGAVRDRLKAEVLTYGLSTERTDTGLIFEPWFFLDHDAVYIEHGHRFDPYATFPDPLMPLDVERRKHLAPNFGHFSLRYFCNRVRTFPIHDMDQNPFGKVWAWMREQTLRTLCLASIQFAFFLLRYFTATIKDRRLKLASADIFSKRRRARLKAYARHYNLPLRRILALDALKRSHVGATVGRLFQALHLDRILAGVVAGTIILCGLFLTEGWLLLCLIAACLLGTRMLIQRLDRSRPIVDVQPILGRVAAKISRVTGASVVVFGHTHQPALRRVGKARWLNPGSWEHLPWCRGHAKNEPCNCAVRFGLIRSRSGHADVELRQWCVHGGHPAGQANQV